MYKDGTIYLKWHNWIIWKKTGLNWKKRNWIE